ncbi:GIY-YIG nuclease family protein [Patescibacteria group bacterium]|nr:GIY-YIG nuclease family protein [Patescibacteria group bacterium]
MQWRVYYLYSKKIGKYYIGKTNDLKRRLREHNNCEELYTRRGVPWVLIGYIECKDSVEAYNKENKLKKSKNKKYTKWYIQNNGIIMDR